MNCLIREINFKLVGATGLPALVRVGHPCYCRLSLEMLGSLSKTGDYCDSFLDLFADHDSDDYISYPDRSSSPAHPARSDFSELANYDGSSDYTLILDDSDSEGHSELHGRCQTTFSSVTQFRNEDILRPPAGNIPSASVDGESLKTAQ